MGTLGAPTSFEDIMKWVYAEKIDGFASVGVFDTALRIGIHFNIFPTMVYIHAGSEEGTKLLLADCYKSNIAYYFMDDPAYPALDPTSYPNEINRLEPYHIENFLCSKKKQLIKILKF